MDVGCETGKHAKCLIEAGHKVVILDVAPLAIERMMHHLAELNLEHGVVKQLNQNEVDPNRWTAKSLV